MVNSLTGARYTVLVLPVTEVLPEETARLLETFTAAGGRVIAYHSNIDLVVGKEGGHMTGRGCALPDQSRYIQARTVAETVAMCREGLCLPFRILCGVDEVSRTQMSYPARVHDPYVHDGEQQYGVGVTRYLKDGRRILNFTNYNDRDEELTVWVEANTVPDFYIPETGEVYAASEARVQDNGYVFTFTLPKNRAYFIVSTL